MRPPYIVSVRLILKDRRYFVWAPVALNDVGMQVGRRIRPYREQLSASAHIIDVATKASLCDRYHAKKVPKKCNRAYAEQWGNEMPCLSRVTAVEKTGTASFNGSTNITFLRICKDCLRAATGVYIGLDLNDVSYDALVGGRREVYAAADFDFDKWEEHGLNG